VVPLLFGSAIMVWVYRDFDFSKVGQVLCHEMNWWWMSLSLVFGVFGHIFRGWRWKQALEPLGAHPKTSNCVNAVFISYAANLLVPRLGEVSRCGVLSRYDGISFTRSLGTVVTERLIDFLCAGLITAVAVLTQMKVFREFFRKTGTNLDSITDVFVSPYFYIILFCVIGIIVLLYFLIRALSFFEKVRGVALNIWTGIISLKDVRNKVSFVCYTLLIWFCYFMQFYMAFFCFGFTAGLAIPAGLVMFVGGSIAVMVPTPNGAGPWHFAVISMMILYGVSAGDAGIFALIVHGIQTFLVILLGIYGSVALSVINKKHSL
jgi:uncharacterized membrane protein YbhN (UPF0104 family)